MAALTSAAQAQNHPTKPIRVLVPVPAGGTADIFARMLAPAMSNLLGQQLVIDNRGGKPDFRRAISAGHTT